MEQLSYLFDERALQHRWHSSTGWGPFSLSKTKIFALAGGGLDPPHRLTFVDLHLKEFCKGFF
jgi:hypothetical protein